MNKYLKITLFTIKKEITFIYDYISSLFAYAIHIAVFYLIWDYVLASKQDIAGYNKESLIWYVIIGEIIMYAIRDTSGDISSQVKNGDIANMLVRPINFAAYMFSQRLSNFVRAGINILFAVFMGSLMAPHISICGMQVIFSFISLFLSVIIAILIDIVIGLFSFFIEEVKSLRLIVSKLMLLLVFSPLEMFDEVFQVIFLVMPTTYAVYAPARIFAKYDLKVALFLIVMQVISILVLIFVTKVQYERGVKKINANGG